MEREVTIELLEQYKEFRFLWDNTDDKYSHKDSRQNALSILLDIYKKIDKTATIAILKKKIENMRATYNRERKKVGDMCFFVVMCLDT